MAYHQQRERADGRTACFDGCFIHTPGWTDPSLIVMPAFFKLWDVVFNPSEDCSVE
jgi:hypothetical protein